MVTYKNAALNLPVSYKYASVAELECGSSLVENPRDV